MIQSENITLSQFLHLMQQSIGSQQIDQLNALNENTWKRAEETIRAVKIAYRGFPEIGYAFITACEGIIWALTSGRVGGITCVTIKAMPVHELLTLVYNVSQNNTVMGTVPAYLMSHVTIPLEEGIA